MNKVRYKGFDYIVDVDNNNKPIGKGVSFFPNNSVFKEVYFENGMLNGESLTFSINGNLIEQCYYKDDLLHGKYCLFYDDKSHKIKIKGNYLYGSKDGFIVEYDINNEIVETYLIEAKMNVLNIKYDNKRMSYLATTNESQQNIIRFNNNQNVDEYIIYKEIGVGRILVLDILQYTIELHLNNNEKYIYEINAFLEELMDPNEENSYLNNLHKEEIIEILIFMKKIRLI